MTAPLPPGPAATAAAPSRRPTSSLPLAARWRVSQRFRFGHDRTYTFCKLLLDPVYTAVLAELRPAPELPLLDVGCGPGLLAAVLRDGGFRAPILGIDYDPRKTDAATEALHGHPECSFHPGDARSLLPVHAGHVTILDILQYFSPAETARLLERAARCVAPGGLLLIRSSLRDHSWRFRLSRATDWIAKASAWMKESPKHYPSREEITAILAGAGLTGSVRKLSGPLPLNNYLLVFGRKP